MFRFRKRPETEKPKGQSLFEYWKLTVRGTDNEPSSQKITAFWFVMIISFIISNLIALVWVTVILNFDIKENTMQLITLLGSTILLGLLGAILGLYGVRGWAAATFKKAENPPPPPPPPVNETNILQTGPEQVTNINNPKEKPKEAEL